MFYSQYLLSKNGALGIVWVAAHCFKRLNKRQVSQTNICSSVDKILVDEVPVVTHRVLAYLLLGVVKIYSKKVEYLYDDCNRVIGILGDFSVSKKGRKHILGMRAPHLSITRPKTLALDTFDLEIVDDENGGNVKADEDITLEAAWINEGTRPHSPNKKHYDGDVSCPQTCSTAHTPVKDVLSPYAMEKDVGSSLRMFLDSESSIEKLRKDNFSLGERLDPMLFGEGREAGGEPGLFGSSFEKNESDGNQKKLFNKLDEDRMDEMHIIETELPGSVNVMKEVNTEERSVSMKVDVTFESRGPYDSGAILPGLIDVQTPVIREQASASRKRKCLFDEAIVLSNRMVKQSISDTSSLVSKRRKAPHTALQAWKSHKFYNFPQAFLEPFSTCSSLKLKSLFDETKFKCLETGENVNIEGGLEKSIVPESPAAYRSPNESKIAPSTPVTQSASLRLHDDVEITELDRGGPASSFRSVEKELDSREEEGSDRFLTNEEMNLYEDGEGGDHETDEWSDRTRSIIRLLCRSFLRKRGRGQIEGLYLSELLKKKNKSESARFFYETLVLKTSGYIDVKQVAPYDDILVLETPKLKVACEQEEVDL